MTFGFLVKWKDNINLLYTKVKGRLDCEERTFMQHNEHECRMKTIAAPITNYNNDIVVKISIVVCCQIMRREWKDLQNVFNV